VDKLTGSHQDTANDINDLRPRPSSSSNSSSSSSSNTGASSSNTHSSRSFNGSFVDRCTEVRKVNEAEKNTPKKNISECSKDVIETDRSDIGFIKTASGKIDLKGCAVDGTIETASGDISIVNSTGESIITQQGKVSLKGSTVNKYIKTASGNVTVSHESKIGSIDTQQGTAKIENSQISGNLQTNSGNITLRDIPAVNVIVTTSGKIDLVSDRGSPPLPVSQREKTIWPLLMTDGAKSWLVLKLIWCMSVPSPFMTCSRKINCCRLSVTAWYCGRPSSSNID